MADEDVKLTEDEEAAIEAALERGFGGASAADKRKVVAHYRKIFAAYHELRQILTGDAAIELKDDEVKMRMLSDKEMRERDAAVEQQRQLAQVRDVQARDGAVAGEAR